MEKYIVVFMLFAACSSDKPWENSWEDSGADGDSDADSDTGSESEDSDGGDSDSEIPDSGMPDASEDSGLSDSGVDSSEPDGSDTDSVTDTETESDTGSDFQDSGIVDSGSTLFFCGQIPTGSEVWCDSALGESCCPKYTSQDVIFSYVCTNLLWDPINCGTCDFDCGTEPFCDNGVCTDVMPTDF